MTVSTVSLEELKSIMTGTHSPAVSLFLPTHRAGPEIQQDPIRLKNLLKQAEQQLIAKGSRPADARELLQPISDLLDDAGFWRQQDDGLAIFRSSRIFRMYRVPLALDEFCSVADRFYLKPLLPLLINDGRFYILALSHKAVRLLDCSRDGVHEIDLPDVPQGIQEGLPVGPAPQLQMHALPLGGNQTARFHGHGVGTDDADVTNLTRYFQRVEDGLSPVLKDRRDPMILACVAYLAPLFKGVSRYPQILDAIVSGNPDGLQNEELHGKAGPIAEAHFRQAHAMTAAQYLEGIAKARAGNRLQDVLPAAYQGRVASLFVPLRTRRWGRFDADRLAVEEHHEQRPGDDEFLDLAATQTLLHGGAVYGVEPDEVPDRQLVAAVYRF
jgi:hypothetical protein